MAQAPYGSSTQQQQFSPAAEQALTAIKEQFVPLTSDERIAVLNEVTNWLKAAPPGQEGMKAEG